MHAWMFDTDVDTLIQLGKLVNGKSNLLDLYGSSCPKRKAVYVSHFSIRCKKALELTVKLLHSWCLCCWDLLIDLNCVLCRESGQFCAIKEVQVILDDSNSKERLRQLNQVNFSTPIYPKQLYFYTCSMQPSIFVRSRSACILSIYLLTCYIFFCIARK
jgi:hypothetical protein